MILDGWVDGKLDPKRPTFNIGSGGGRMIRSSNEGERALKAAQEKRGG